MADLSPDDHETQMIGIWRVTAQAARDGNIDAARDLLREFVEAVTLAASSPRDVAIPRPHAEYIAAAFRRILDDGTKPAHALGLKQPRAGRPRGAGITHDPVKLAAAFWVARRRGRSIEQANGLIGAATGADRTTVQDAVAACSAFEDAALVTDNVLVAIASGQPSLAEMLRTL